MTLINSTVGSFSGVVAYEDGSNASFHTQMENFGSNTGYWSTNNAESLLTTGNIDDQIIYHNAFTSCIETILGPITWSAPQSTNKAIRDVVFHIKFTMTVDDGRTYSGSAVYERGALNTYMPDFTSFEVIPDNIEDVYNQMLTALDKICTVIVL